MEMKSGIRAIARVVLRNVRNGIATVVAVLASAVIRLFPAIVRVRINPLTRFVGRMDYPAHPLVMFVESLTELGRLKSCKKEPETVKWIEEFMGQNDVFYDIGANIGAYSLIAASRIGQGSGRVVAFEPSFRNFSRLNENLELNGCSEKVTTVSIALSNAVDIATFRFSSAEVGAALHNLEGKTLRRNARAGVSASHVLTMPLDTLVEQFDLPRPTVIKLDVDGPEFEILQGASNILDSPGLKSIQIEVEPDEVARARIRDYLEAKGWILRGRSKHHGNAVDEDWVWVRRSGAFS